MQPLCRFCLSRLRGGVQLHRWMDGLQCRCIRIHKMVGSEKRGASFAHSKKDVFIPKSSFLSRLPKVIYGFEEFETAIQKTLLYSARHRADEKRKKPGCMPYSGNPIILYPLRQEASERLWSDVSSKTASLDKQRLNLSAQFDGMSFEGILSIRNMKRKAAKEIGQRV